MVLSISRNRVDFLFLVHIPLLISVLWKKYKIWSYANQCLNRDSSTIYLLDLGQLTLPLWASTSISLFDTSAGIAFWFGSYCSLRGHRVQGLLVQKREGRGGGEGERQVLRTVRTGGICDNHGIFITICPPIGSYMKNLWIFYVNFSLSKIRFMLFFFSPSGALRVWER